MQQKPTVQPFERSVGSRGVANPAVPLRSGDEGLSPSVFD